MIGNMREHLPICSFLNLTVVYKYSIERQKSSEYTTNLIQFKIIHLAIINSYQFFYV